MDWALVIRRNRNDLLPIVATIVAMLPDGVVSRRVHRAILALLRPAESVLRRLIAIAARDIVVGPKRESRPPEHSIPRGKGTREPIFNPFDARRTVGPKEKRAPGNGPGLWYLDGTDQRAPAPAKIHPDDEIDATRLRRRIAALRMAADDIEGHARRLARILAHGRSKWRQVMRPGRPPGYRANGRRPVDVLLAECQELALMALNTANAP
jgi:hypothetical protein